MDYSVVSDSGRYLTIAFGILALTVSTSEDVLAIPKNPENLMVSSNCEEARLKLQQAKKGSPLISADENEAILKKAEKNVRDLCS